MAIASPAAASTAAKKPSVRKVLLGADEDLQWALRCVRAGFRTWIKAGLRVGSLGCLLSPLTCDSLLQLCLLIADYLSSQREKRR